MRPHARVTVLASALLVFALLSACTGPKGDPGAAGPQGPQGAAGADGQQGPPGIVPDFGKVPANAAPSCAEIKRQIPSSGDGIYLLDADGAGSNPPFQAYCDMTRDGGGWTLIMRVWHNSGIYGMAGGFGSPMEANSPKQEPYKLADAVVNAIIGDGNFDILVDQIGHQTVSSTGNHEYIVIRNYTGTYTYTATVPESTTATVFESYRAVDGALAWRGRLQCGEPGVGINCFNVLTTPNPVGAPNPQGGQGCLINLGTASNTGWHTLYQGLTNSDTYIYICNGSQHTSSYSNVHRWWVR